MGVNVYFFQISGADFITKVSNFHFHIYIVDKTSLNKPRYGTITLNLKRFRYIMHLYEEIKNKV
jgi:hypothetical protein